MRLPDGTTCVDCSNFLRCNAFIGVRGDETACDWSHSRFQRAFPEVMDVHRRHASFTEKIDRLQPGAKP